MRTFTVWRTVVLGRGDEGRVQVGMADLDADEQQARRRRRHRPAARVSVVVVMVMSGSLVEFSVAGAAGLTRKVGTGGVTWRHPTM